MSDITLSDIINKMNQIAIENARLRKKHKSNHSHGHHNKSSRHHSRKYSRHQSQKHRKQKKSSKKSSHNPSKKLSHKVSKKLSNIPSKKLSRKPSKKLSNKVLKKSSHKVSKKLSRKVSKNNKVRKDGKIYEFQKGRGRPRKYADDDEALEAKRAYRREWYMDKKDRQSAYNKAYYQKKLKK